MDIDGAFVDVDVAAPDLVQELLAREHAAGIFQQELQQPELGRPERHLAARARHALGVAVELDVAGRERGRDPLGLRAAQQRADAGEQLRNREGLDDVVVGAGREPADALAFLAARGEHDDRQPARLRLGPQASDELDARKPRQHPVDHREVGRGFLEAQLGLVAAPGGVDRIAFGFEIVAQEERKRLLVLDDQDSGRHEVQFPPVQFRNGTLVTAVVSPLGRSSAMACPSTM